MTKGSLRCISQLFMYIKEGQIKGVGKTLETGVPFHLRVRDFDP